jgi:hypothetical protein
MVPTTSVPSLRGARGLRFIVILVGGWALVRVMAHWSPVYSLSDAGLDRTLPSSVQEGDRPLAGKPKVVAAKAVDEPHDRVLRLEGMKKMSLPVDRYPAASPQTDRDRFLDKRSFPDFATNSRPVLTHPDQKDRSAFVGGGGAVSARWDASLATGQTQGMGMRRDLSGWSLSGWVHVREGGGGRTRLPLSPQLGASQAGVRLAYGWGASGRLRAYGRTTVAFGDVAQSDLAFGAAFAPIKHVPFDVSVERRVAVGRRGRNAMAVMASGGVSDVTLIQGFRLDAYGQGGLVGAHRRDGFADGALSVTRDVARIAGMRLSAGGMMAGAVQPGAARVDVGPRLLLHVPNLGGGSRIMVDWRQRVAGNALPGNGVALTLATDF